MGMPGPSMGMPGPSMGMPGPSMGVTPGPADALRPRLVEVMMSLVLVLLQSV